MKNNPYILDKDQLINVLKIGFREVDIFKEFKSKELLEYIYVEFAAILWIKTNGYVEDWDAAKIYPSSELDPDNWWKDGSIQLIVEAHKINTKLIKDAVIKNATDSLLKGSSLYYA